MIAPKTPGAEFLDQQTIAELTAKMFLDVGAVRFMQDKPFIFRPGWAKAHGGVTAAAERPRWLL